MSSSSIAVKRALVSVSDKTGVVDFCAALHEQGVQILSTGGTALSLQNSGVEVTPVEHYTGSPEIMDGRVKTLHPRVHGGILAVRDNPAHLQQMRENGIESIDMVVVNLYPFKKTIASPGVTLEDAIENIDIGGPTMVRSAAKNHRYVAVVVDPHDYGPILEELRAGQGLSLETRQRLCVKAFTHTADYDTAISSWLARQYINSF